MTPADRPGTLSREAPVDLTNLARHARAGLAAGRDATLLIARFGRLPVPDTEVVLYDDGGQPSFICDVYSPVAAAAGQAALLTVTTDIAGRIRATVILAGRLTRADRPQPLLPGPVTITLPVALVVVEYHCREDAPLVQQTIPLDLYWPAGKPCH